MLSHCCFGIGNMIICVSIWNYQSNRRRRRQCRTEQMSTLLPIWSVTCVENVVLIRIFRGFFSSIFFTIFLMFCFSFPICSLATMRKSPIYWRLLFHFLRIRIDLRQRKKKAIIIEWNKIFKKQLHTKHSHESWLWDQIIFTRDIWCGYRTMRWLRDRCKYAREKKSETKKWVMKKICRNETTFDGKARKPPRHDNERSLIARARESSCNRNWGQIIYH